MAKTGLAVLALALAGCATSGRIEGDEDRERYLDFCRELAMMPVTDKGEDEVLSGADWMVYPCSFTSHEFKKEYRIVYADERYLSYRCEEFVYMGGAHGLNVITVGTIERGSGKKVALKDVFSGWGEEKLAKALREKAIERLGGEYELQGEPGPTENFCLMADGWHFVYNEYEIACYAAGAVEVVINL